MLTIKQCPRTLRTPEIEDLIDLSDLAAEGHWPVAGGTLDQSDSFVKAHDFIQAVTLKLNTPTKPNG